MAMEGEFKKYLDDVYSEPPIPREALTDECEILVVGAGFGGLLLWHKLSQAGFTDVRFCEKGGDVGGTWYWNRYPGIACDVESYSYLPLLEEMGYIPSMKFASGFEILEYCQTMAAEVRVLRPLPVPHDGRGDDLGRGIRPLDRRNRSRRQDACALRDPGQRHPDDAEAGAHRRHGEVQGRVLPYLALGLQHRSARQAGRHHRDRRDGCAGGAGARQGRRAALRVPAHTVLDRRARPARDHRRRAGDLGQRARMGSGKARALREDIGRPHCHPGQR